PAHHHARPVRRRRRLPALTTPPPTEHETTGPSGPHPGVPEQERPTMPRQRVATPAATATELVNAYRPRDFLLTSASGSLLGRGVLATATGVEDLSGVLGEVATDTGQAALAVGALPFDRDAPAHLVVPETVRRGPAAASAAEA